jgi:diguanylate cyclase (GGDEF)-like protein/PAS domain S-box-containing protein
METGKTSQQKNGIDKTRAALRLVVFYVVLACVWIFFSDELVASLFKNHDTITLISIIKGWLFVAVTAVLFFFLIRRLLGQVLAESQNALKAHAETVRAQNLLNNIVNSSTDVIFAKDIAGHYLLINREAARAGGKTPEQVLGQDDTVLFPIEQAAEIHANDLHVIQENRTISYEMTLTTPEGDRTYMATKAPLYGDNEKVIGLFGIGRDITERKAREEALKKSEEKFSKAFQASAAAITIASIEDGRYIEVNDTFLQITGYERHEVIGHTSTELKVWINPGDRQKYVDELIRNGSLRNFEISLRMKSGEIRMFSVSTEFFELQGKTCTVNFILDITDRKQAEEAIHNLAYFDGLTKLPNRRLLMDRLGHALIASKRSQEYGAVLILDLDNFKALNDTKGHDVGDCLLVEVARRILHSVRPEDTVSRLGGDEYVIMAEDLGTDETSVASRAEIIAGKIRAALNQPYTLVPGEAPHYSTPSIGVTLFRGDELSIDVLLKQADMALYQAKGAGRNTIRFFNPAMQAAIESRAHMEAALRSGLAKNEFQLFYQPQIDRHGKVTGAEALLRWLPRGQAAVPPVQFIPLAEDTGLIVPLGLWVLQTACAQLKAWQANPQTRGLQMSINVSARQFRQADFVEQIFDTLKQTGADASKLKLELTESVVLENVEEVVTRMEQIKAFGVTFSIDDFGTGFSSLSYLKQLPLSEVKIDKSFVRDITTDPSDAAIVRAIIAMSQSLGIDVIAEGVETQAQLQFLKENGCNSFQGYLFSQPIPIEHWKSEFNALADVADVTG